MTVTVADASVLAPALADDSRYGNEIRRSLRGANLIAPELVDIEVVSAFRRFARAGRLDERRSAQALADLAALPLRRAPHLPFLPRIWELRENLSSYDAAYVALAEAFDALLVTADARLARAPGLSCDVEVLG